jgi:hypothetical protein
MPGIVWSGEWTVGNGISWPKWSWATITGHFCIPISGIYPPENIASTDLCLPCAFVLFVPLHHLFGRINGEPFVVGDQVRILVGPNRDRVVQVYSVWRDRRQVRVELDPTSKAKFNDIFPSLRFVGKSDRTAAIDSQASVVYPK